MRDADGKQIVELPPKEVVVEELLFSAMERKIYDSIFSTVKKDFDRLNAKGLVSQNYTHILAMLMRYAISRRLSSSRCLCELRQTPSSRIASQPCPLVKRRGST